METWYREIWKEDKLCHYLNSLRGQLVYYRSGVVFSPMYFYLVKLMLDR